MPLKKDEAVVLSKRHFGESDRIVTLFTFQSGKIFAIAKGGNRSVRRFMNTLEPFYLLSIEYFDKSTKGIVRLENAYVIYDTSGIEKDLKRFSIAFLILELVDKLTREREPHPNLYQVLKEASIKLKGSEFSPSQILGIILKVLEETGFLPNFKSCVRCGKGIEPNKLRFFSLEKGGVLCENCYVFYPILQVDNGLLSLLLDPKDLPDGKLFLDALGLIADFLRYQLDVDLKTLPLLKSYLA